MVLGRFCVGLGSVLGRSGVDQGIFKGCSGDVLGMFRKGFEDVVGVISGCFGGVLGVPRAEQVGYDFSDGGPGSPDCDWTGCTAITAPLEERSDEREVLGRAGKQLSEPT